MTCCKIFKFEAAHKLSRSYTPKCRHIHGHSYKCEIYINENELNDECVVVDFTKVKEVLDPLFDILDHSLLIHTFDKAVLDINKLAKTHKLRLLECNFNPTAEALAMFIFQEGLKRFNIEKIILWETQTGKAEITKKDMENNDNTFEIYLKGCFENEKLVLEN